MFDQYGSTKAYANAPKSFYFWFCGTNPGKFYSVLMWCLQVGLSHLPVLRFPGNL